uniref:Tyrosine specific protein phosphatases domain-containing protein n=1 Tax=Maylandia zebra TaxID=106582 RepID=A0A3P9C2T7_9CICH
PAPDKADENGWMDGWMDGWMILMAVPFKQSVTWRVRTFMTRYYKLIDILQSYFYIKIFIKDRHVPSDASILIHCTYGVNHIGYLVCRYLIDVDGLDPPAELELFNSSGRGHCFKRQNCLNDLQSSTKRSK